MAKDAINFVGGPLDGFTFPAPEWPPREEYPWEQVEQAGRYHQRDLSIEGHYVLQSYSQKPESYPDDVNVFRGGRYTWEPQPSGVPYDGQTQVIR